jgi:uncharacterized membrane protein
VTIYLAVKFLHIVGALAVFAAVGLEVAILRGLTLAQSATAAHAAFTGLRVHKRVGLPAMLLIFVPGVYMAISAWGMPAWLLAAIGAMVAIVALESTATRSSLAALEPALQRGSDGGTVVKLLRRLWSSFAARTVLLLGIVALMSMKPSSSAAVLTLVAVASSAALAASFARRRAGRKYFGELVRLTESGSSEV